MATLTLDLDAGILTRAEHRAAEQGTSVDRVVRSYLEEYAANPARSRKAFERILEIADRAGARRGNRTWSRDELHER
jgi:hypothetical protein